MVESNLTNDKDFRPSQNLQVVPDVRIHASLSHVEAPVAQGIEHRPPEAGAEVRILAGALQSRTGRRP